MNNKTHLGIYGLITKNDSILLIEKTRGPYKGLLDLPGGKIEHGETLEEALVREINEETGIIVNKFEIITVLTFSINYIDNDKEISLHHIGIICVVKDFCEKYFSKDLDQEDAKNSNWYKIKDLKSQSLTPFAKHSLAFLK